MNYYQIDTVRFWIGFLLILTLMSAFGLGWLIKSLFFFLLFLLLAPILIVIGFQLWLRASLVTAACPVCGYVSTAIKSQPFNCPSCGEALEVSGRQFIRIPPPGTIDVEVQTID